MSGYYIVLNPATYDLMSIDGEHCTSPSDLINYLANPDARPLDEHNYLDFLRFDPLKRREGMVESFGIENGAAIYVGNQIARLAPEATVVHADDYRRTIREIIESRRTNPAAVFMTTISSNFPVAVATAIVLNHARIPVILGGIHVSTAPNDVDLFIRAHCPYPELVALVKGPGDSSVLGEVLSDLAQSALRPEYLGHTTIEDGVWRTPPNVVPLPPLTMQTRRRVPLLGRYLEGRVRTYSVAPSLGCPFSCSFCSISTLPLEQRRVTMRSPRDFLDELTAFHETKDKVRYPVLMFCTDNLLQGGDVLDEMLDGIIERRLKTPFIAQISVEIASRDELLDRMRRAGAILFEIGFESLDLRNLEYIGKHAAYDIEESGTSPAEYYSRQIKKIQEHGIAIQGSFIFGLPFDRFESLESNTGTEVAQFCIDNHISLMSGCYSVMPGARAFEESVAADSWLYGRPGTMDYLRALCLADHSEMNTRPTKGMLESALLTAIAALESLRIVAGTGCSIRSACHIARRAFACPTARGRDSSKERINDALFAFASHLITASLYHELGKHLAASRNGVKGAVDRLLEREVNPEVRQLCREYVARYL